MRLLLAALLLLLVPAPAYAAPDLGVQLYPSPGTDPGERVILAGRVGNVGDEEALDVRLEIRFPAGFALVRIIDFYGWYCEGGEGRIDCRSIGMEPGDSFFSMELSTPRDPSLTIAARVTAATADADRSNDAATSSIPFTRFFTVDSSADSGPGTLRNVLAEVNRVCDGVRLCKVEITGMPRVELLSPLPPITGNGIVLGSNADWTQTPIQPVIELNGSRLERGDGLILRSTAGSFEGIEVRGFVINGFPGNGILIDGGPVSSQRLHPYTLLGNAIGTDVTGTRAIPNGLRGVAIHAPRSSNFLRNNLISGNGRSGISIWSATSTRLSDNRIGTERDRDLPLANGASGVFIGRDSRSTSFSGGIIAFHPDFGVAIERGASEVWISPLTRVVQNSSLDIDWGLDGPSLEDAGSPPVARISGATYDSDRNVTIVTGRCGEDASFGGYMVITIMVADSTNQHGIVPFDVVAGIAYSNAGQHFVVEIPGDLRGRFVSAHTVMYLWPDLLPNASSELSLAVKVE